jgi:trimethylguanosine synthase
MAGDEGARRVLEADFAAHGPWGVDDAEGFPAAPCVFVGRDAIAWVVSPARAAAEQRGHAVLAEHPLRPELLAARGGLLVFAGVGDVEDPTDAMRAAPGVWRRIEGTRRDLLARMGPDVRASRALARLGVPQKHCDRFLSANVEVETRLGPSFGGVHPAFFRAQGQRTVGLRCDRATRDGWLALDLAALALGGDGLDEGALRALHREGADDPEAADRAFELALLAVLLREAVIGRDADSAARALEIVPIRREPERVRVWIEGPRLVPDSLWHAPGEEVSASRARWLLSTLDGLAVGGGALRVRTEPPLRAGRRGSTREPRATRRARIFSRWSEGIATDDEGLYSATPEAIALRIAGGARGVILDGTCGVGALAIAYARQPDVERVVAVDLDAGRLGMARHNAELYGVATRIDFVNRDARDVVREARADLLVLDPPWGGRGYDRERVGLDALGMDVGALVASFEGPVVLKLPRSFDVATLPLGRWTVEPMIDDRGILKCLVARREGVS